MENKKNEWWRHIKKGDKFKCVHTAPPSPNGESKNGGGGFTSNRKFTLDHVTFHREETKEPFAILWPKESFGGGIFHNAVISPEKKYYNPTINLKF